MNEAAPRRVVVAGATGLVGQQLVTLAGGRTDLQVTALVRSRGKASWPVGVDERIFDYESDDAYAELAGLEPFAVLCALGTTRKRAGSDQAFRRVDHDYPVRLLEAAGRSSRRPRFGLVSSVGAGSRTGLYLRTKTDVEDAVRASGLEFAIVRPSFLEGDRAESRLGETIASFTLGPLMHVASAISRGMKRYAPIEASDVARALLAVTVDAPPAGRVLEGEPLFEAARRYAH